MGTGARSRVDLGRPRLSGHRSEHAHLAASGRARYEPVTDAEVVEAFQLCSRTEGIIPALESAHALAWIAKMRDEVAGTTILVNMSGRGDKDVNQMMDVLGS